MNKSIIPLIFILLTILFSACKKQNTSPYHIRDKYYGLAYVNDKIVFGNIDMEGVEEITDTLEGLVSFYYSSTDYNAEDKYYFFAGKKSVTADPRIFCLHAESGRIVADFKTTELDPQSLQYLDDNQRVYGLGYRGDKLIFGSSDLAGKEQIIKMFEDIYDFIPGSQKLDDKHDNYIFSSHDTVQNIPQLHKIDVSNGAILATLPLNLIDPLTIEYFPKEDLFYGLGIQQGQVVLVSLSHAGGEEVVHTFENLEAYDGGSTTHDASRNYYMFTSLNLQNGEQIVHVFSLRFETEVYSFETYRLEEKTLE